jgi:probable HAF family extracellular repeat protein
MKFRISTLVFSLCALAALTTSVQSFAQQHHRYKVVILGTDGGPDSYIEGYDLPYAPLNNQGTIGVEGDTSVPGAYNSYTWTDGKQTDLQALPTQPGSPPNGTYINWLDQWGIAVGYSANGQQDPITGAIENIAALWTPDGRITNLGTLGGYQSHAIWVNDFGQVSGWVENTTPDPYSMGAGAETQGFIWQYGVMRQLGTLGGPDSYGEFINNLGQVSGHSYTSAVPNPITGVPPFDPFIWENGKMTDINPGDFGGAEGGTNFLDNQGRAVGFGSLLGEQSFHPFLWQNGKLTDLSTIGNLGGSLGSAYTVNEPGDVIGIYTLPGPGFVYHAVLWSGRKFTDLQTVDGDGCSQPFSINLLGQVVGFSGACDGSTSHAFLWENGEIVDLDTLIPSNSGVQLQYAGWINDNGEIAAQAVLTEGGAYRAVLLIPDSDCDSDCDGRVTASQNGAITTPAAADATKAMTKQGAVLGYPANPLRPSLLRPTPPTRWRAQKQD